MHSSDRVRSFLRLLAVSPTCSFLHAVQTVTLCGFDDPYTTVRHPKQFLQKTLNLLGSFDQLQELTIQHAFGGSGAGTTPLCSLIPQLRKLSLGRMTMWSLADLARLLAGLTHLEDFSLHGELLHEIFDEEILILPPVPRSLRKLVLNLRCTSVNQCPVFTWLSKSRPSPTLETLSLNPRRKDLGAFSTLLATFRHSLRDLYIRPVFKDGELKYTVETTVYVSQDEITFYGIGIIEIFGSCGLPSLRHLTFSFPFRTFIKSEDSGMSYLLEWINRILGPATFSSREVITIQIHPPIPLNGIGSFIDMFAARPPEDQLPGQPYRYSRYPNFKRLEYILPGMEQEAMMELGRTFEKICPRVIERGILHLRSV